MIPPRVVDDYFAKRHQVIAEYGWSVVSVYPEEKNEIHLRA